MSPRTRNESKFTSIIARYGGRDGPCLPALVFRLYFLRGDVACCGCGSIPPGNFFEARPFMPLRALLYRRPTEPQAITVVFDKSVYLVRLRRHRQARRYTLRIQAATREV